MFQFYRESLSETQVNEDSTFSSGLSVGAALSDGGWVVTWGSYGQSYRQGFHMRRYDEDGTPLTDALTIDTGDARIGNVTAHHDGGWLVTYADYGTRDAFVLRFDASGSQVGSTTLLPTTALGAARIAYPFVEVLPNGGWVAAWNHGNSATGFQIYDAQGQPVGAPFLSDIAQPRIAILDDGGWVVTGQMNDPQTDRTSIFVERYDSSGNLIGEAVRVNEVNARAYRGDIAVLEDGGWVVVWETDEGLDGDGRGIFMQRFDAHGQTIGGNVQVNTSTERDQQDATLLALPDGGWLVAYSSFIDINTDIAIQRYDADGNAVGPEFILNSTTYSGQAFVSLSLLEDGRLLATWDSTHVRDTEVPYYEGVFQRVFDLATVGDSGRDRLVGTTGADHILGQGGTDRLFGRRGEDLLEGGDGRDRIFGGAGNDTLLGGGGRDKLFGGTGDDDLLGGQKNDVLFGGKGADRLVGGGGNDRLQGDAGDDTLHGGAGADTFVFAAGFGHDVIQDFDIDRDALELGSDLFGGNGPTQEELHAMVTYENDVTHIVFNATDSLTLEGSYRLELVNGAVVLV